MYVRNIPAGMDPDIVARIDERLLAIRSEHGVSIPLAIESGSRAWGFPSPDSDYDCRFIFVRPLDQHLSLWPARDVIETPLDAIFDVNGWELGKALKLMLRGNAVVIEWLTSPISYGSEQRFQQEFLSLARRVADRSALARHYLHLGERQRRIYFTDENSIPQKKIFYALRPAAALRWLRLHPDEPIAPMHFPTLLNECEPPGDVRAITDDLMARKAVTHELGSEVLPLPLANFIDAEFGQASDLLKDAALHPTKQHVEEAETFFRETVKRMSA